MEFVWCSLPVIGGRKVPLAWKTADWQIGFLTPIYAPTGSYQPGDPHANELANRAKNQNAASVFRP